MAKNKLGMKKFKEDNIELVSRSGKMKQQRNRDIILQIKCKTTKDLFQQSRKKLTEGVTPANKIYLNADLTEFRQNYLMTQGSWLKGRNSKQHGYREVTL